MSIPTYNKTTWVDKATTLGPSNQQIQEDGIKNNNTGLLDLDQSNKYVLLSYIGAGLFAADTVIAFDDKKEILIELEATELDPTTPLKISVDNQVTEYLVKVGDVLNSLLVSDGQGNKFTLHRDGSVAIIPKEESSKTDEVEYNLPIQSQQTIVPVEASPFGDNKIEGESPIQIVKFGDFRSGALTYWVGTAGVLTLGVDVLEITGDGTSTNVRATQVVPYSPIETYIIVLMRDRSGLANTLRIGSNIAAFGVDVSNPVLDKWYPLGVIRVITTDTELRIQTLYDNVGDANGAVTEVKLAMSIPLLSVKQLAMTLTQLNAKYPVYFESLKSVENPEIKVTNENIFDKVFTTETVGLEYNRLSKIQFSIKGISATGLGTESLFPNIAFKPLTQYTFSGNQYEDDDSKNTVLSIKYTDGTTDFFPSPTLIDTAFSITSDSGKTIDFISYGYSNTGGTTTYTNFMINEGISAAAIYVDNDNSSKKYPNQILRRVSNGTEDVEDYIDTENNDLHELVGYDYNDVLQGQTAFGITGILTNTQSFFKTLASTFGFKVPTSDATVTKIFLKIGNIIFTVVSASTQSATDEENTVAINSTGRLLMRVNKTTYPNTAAFEAYLQANNVEFQYELETEVITEDIDVDGIAFAYKNMTIELIQDNGFGFSVYAKHAQNDAETIKLLGKDLEQTKKELDIYTNLKPVYQFDTDDSTTIDLSNLAKGLYNIEATLKSGASSNSNIALTGYTGRSLALNNVALAITNSYIEISNSNNVVLTKSLLLVKEDRHAIVSELIATTILDADIDRYQSIKTDLLIESLPVGYTIVISRI